jgi:2-methylcitrate dehydratase PrpD
MTTELATWLATATFEHIPLDVREIARRAALDTIGVMLAGTREPVVTTLHAVLAESAGAPVASQVGTAFRTSPEDAALLNGASAHALDFDDVAVAANAHASAVVLPAVLAAAECTGASGRSGLTAFALGLETVARIGQAMGGGHYAHGWHATSTVGVIGAAVGAGHLLSLDAACLQNAVGIAASSASGLRQNFGTMTKPLHAGHAARCGVFAARLAAHGLTAADDALEGSRGFFALFSFGEAQPGRALEALGAEWELAASGISTKRFACCFALHRAIDGALALREEHRVDPDDVERVDVSVPVGGLAPLLGDDSVVDGMTAKFSMGYAIAAALADGALTLETFDDSIAHRPDLRRLLERVHAREDPSIPAGGNPFDGGWVEVRIGLVDGRTPSTRVTAPSGSPAKPLSDEALEGKFRDCATMILNARQVENALEALNFLDRSPNIGELMATLRPQTS